MGVFSNQAVEVACWTAFDEQMKEIREILVFPPQRDHLVVLTDGSDFVDEFDSEITEFFESLDEGDYDSVDDAASAFVSSFVQDWHPMGGDAYQVTALRQVARGIANRHQLADFCEQLNERMGI